VGVVSLSLASRDGLQTDERTAGAGRTGGQRRAVVSQRSSDQTPGGSAGGRIEWGRHRGGRPFPLGLWNAPTARCRSGGSTKPQPIPCVRPSAPPGPWRSGADAAFAGPPPPANHRASDRAKPTEPYVSMSPSLPSSNSVSAYGSDPRCHSTSISTPISISSAAYLPTEFRIRPRSASGSGPPLVQVPPP